MLVELLIRRWEHHTMLPVNSREVRITIVPQQRIPMPCDAHDMETGPVPVTFFIGSYGHLGDMCMHHTISEHEHNICSACSAVAPRTKLNFREVWDEVGLPHVITLANLMEITVTSKVSVLTRSNREIIRVIENKGLVIEQVHHCRTISRRDYQSPIVTTPIKVAVLRVERNSK